MTYNVLLEDLITDLGGCGLYQWLLAAIVHVGKTIATWSMITMTFAGQDPGFLCYNGQYGNNESVAHSYNDTLEDKCNVNSSSCTDYVFQTHMKTVVSDFDLVCDKKWISATITTIQMGGVLLGCIVSGHLADMIGRKPTYFLAIFATVAFNLAGYFSPSWQVYAALRFLIGIGVGFYLTVQYSFTNEFASAKWRPPIVTTPSWALESSLFALVAWGFHDWKKIHLAIAIVGAPFLLAWWIMPESFRWLVTKQRFKQAERVVNIIAKVNKAEKPTLDKIFAEAKLETNQQATSKRYSFLDLFRTRESTKTTIGLLFAWFAASYGYYGITFGVKSLSGDLYLNMFLINVVETPVMVLTAFLVNWFGRKKVCFTFYVLAGVTGIGVGVIQYFKRLLTAFIAQPLESVAWLHHKLFSWTTRYQGFYIFSVVC
ncbi:organic cation transporter protein-like isoform X2 [Mercenaria mercenaria]|uniref:organic cation transporter protein-like isoform X2 n=1 Tax=Mercenaria mercenaria TaxID=6596 RepID=UPI00234E9FB5|nr:organic cation transporter protein-like isoform X2 [Mercenaria mercenaria]